ncbi:hypothetical protein DVU_0950 [Nitratidesulfovibrio vulgaris str. Hildenborough]|uniref:Uncharacterized protein n=1 Tax=Nitratidesulfovibrio vulgaris (strain ATCC 29579 / DSM 644 / CCUG 34227 / NCIMB 8303 / VKM B-1760 / Hildenborough) TaxID=882 RepID=Q72DH9_NITV2|nr:hypothetical protein DVU_0950 [Nitratidesulfovibrio vulgaris str. Hildenborough]
MCVTNNKKVCAMGSLISKRCQGGKASVGCPLAMGRVWT